MTDEKDVAAMAQMTQRLLVHLGDQRASGVQIEQVETLGLARHGLRHAMGGKDDRLPGFGNLVQFLDEDGATRLQPLDDVTVVHDLVADIDRRTILLERQDDDLDRPVDAGAKAARTAQPQCHCASRIGVNCLFECLVEHAGNRGSVTATVKPAEPGLPVCALHRATFLAGRAHNALFSRIRRYLPSFLFLRRC